MRTWLDVDGRAIAVDLVATADRRVTARAALRRRVDGADGSSAVEVVELAGDGGNAAAALEALRCKVLALGGGAGT